MSISKNFMIACAFFNCATQNVSYNKLNDSRDMSLQISDDVKIKDAVTYQRFNLGLHDQNMAGIISRVVVSFTLDYLYLVSLRTMHMLI